MEKIYIEEKSQVKKTSNFSIMLSFCIAIFAMFSIGVFGIANLQGNGISYAISPTGDELTFHTWENGDLDVSVFARSTSNNSVFFNVPLYFSDTEHKNPVFCVEKNNAYIDDGTNYFKSDAITDYKLLYLLDHSYVNDVKVLGDDPDDDNAFEAFITQTAIWLYLYRNGASDTNTFTADEINNLKAADYLAYSLSAVDSYTIAMPDGKSVYDVVESLVVAAENYNNEKTISITKAGDEIVKSNDGSVYRSSLITVTGNPSSDFESYSIVTASDKISGAKAIDENGSPLTSLVSPGTRFYITIPADQVTEEVKTLTVYATGNFKSLSGHYYAASDDHQKIISVTGDTTTRTSQLQLQFVGTPDTGMNKAQTIYFVGLIVLLCGIGIVYANAKPVEVQQ